MKKLEEYKKKRDFKKTKEPRGKVVKSKGKKISREQKFKGKLSGQKSKILAHSPKIQMKENRRLSRIYAMQKHYASHLHWDLRLEMDGVLKSWAIPKEPPKTKGEKRLAIQTEDHPMGYEKFKGEIPKGEYGGGKVEIWDSGKYELKNKDTKKIEIIIHGKKLKGHYVLIKTHYGAKPEKSWLFFKV